MAVSLPFVLLLLDWWPLDRLRSSKGDLLHLFVEKLPFLALTFGSCVIAFAAQEEVGALGQLSLWVRVQNAIVSYAAYIGQTLWPTGLSHYYPHAGESLPLWIVSACLALLTGLTLLAIWLSRRFPYVAMGWCWFLGTLVPVIGIVQFGGHARADRFTYVPLVGLFVALSWGIPDLLRGWALRRWLLPTMAGVTLTTLAALTWLQLGHWKTDLILYRHAVDVDERNWVAQNTLGALLGREGRFDEAIQHFEAGIRAKATYADAHFNLAVALYRTGKRVEALGHYREALRIDPDNADRWTVFSGVLQETGRRDEAMGALSEALRIDPQHPQALNRLRQLSADRGR
jgi:tetratricopeptide (TPR) repeat protein